MGVLYGIIFSHTPDEAMSGGQAKACVPGKKYSVLEKIEFLNEYQTEWEAYMPLWKRSLVREVYFYCNYGKRLEKKMAQLPEPSQVHYEMP